MRSLKTDSEMPIAYLNGNYMPLEQASISVMDRGFLFGDGVYEVIPVFGSSTFREQEHLNRLKKSLTAISLKVEMDQFPLIIQGIIKRSPFASEMAIYLQVTRGVGPTRDHRIPSGIKPTIFAYCMSVPHISVEKKAAGFPIVTVEDIRWDRCDIKSLNLLPNIMMRCRAEEMGAVEAIFIREGLALEGTSSNLFIVKNEKLYTPPLSQWVLGGITRELILELAKQEGIVSKEQAITLDELENADEIWITSSTKEIFPAKSLNGKQVGEGKAGRVWYKMHQSYQRFKRNLIS